MRGSSRGLLMTDTQGKLWVVKFQRSSRHRRTLVNDFLATRIADAIGLSVPRMESIDTTAWLSEENSDDPFRSGLVGDINSGRQLASEYAGGLMPGLVVESALGGLKPKLRNSSEFGGIRALDLWLRNTDVRQTLFVRSARQQHYTAVFIDQGHCFGGTSWNLDGPLGLLVKRDTDANDPNGCASVSHHWLKRIAKFDASTLYSIAREVPPEWYINDELAFHGMLYAILCRKKLIANWLKVPFQCCASADRTTRSEVRLTLLAKVLTCKSSARSATNLENRPPSGCGESNRRTLRVTREGQMCMFENEKGIRMD